MKIENLAEDAEDFTGNVWKFSDDNETVLIDVGEGDCWNSIRQLEKVDKVVVTHSHHDHVENLEKVVEKFDPLVYTYEPSNLAVEAESLEEGDSLLLGGERFDIFHTPGHKDDSICLYSETEKVLFTGDLVFPDGGFGRTDLAEGDRDILIESITKIVDLNADEMYCGHGEPALENVGVQLEESLENAEKREPKY